jgi:hypothetical protein
MSQKYPGGFITKSPPLPSGPYETSTAQGVWTLDQAMQFKKQGLWPTAGNIAPPTVIGQAYGGGYYAGQIGVSSVATHYIIVGPLSSATSVLKWKNTNTAATGADSVINGPQNTADMVADGNATVYPAAHFCNDLVVGGQTDWYLPAINELEVCYFNLKPTTSTNNTSFGINPNAVPARASNYTSGNPAQTSATDFKNTGTQNFNAQTYWTSTDVTSYGANTIDFGAGTVYIAGKAYTNNVRAIRREAV